MPGVFGHRQNENLPVIKRMLLTALQSTSEALRVQAVKAVGAFILLHDKEPAIHKHFSDLLVPLMQVSYYLRIYIYLAGILKSSSYLYSLTSDLASSLSLLNGLLLIFLRLL